MTTHPGSALQRVYETVFITPPSLTDADLDKVIGEVKDALASRGAEVKTVEKWGRRKLAYPIGKQNEGWYVLLQVHGPGTAIQEAERRMRISDNVLRYLSVRLDDVPGALEYTEQRAVRRARAEEERATRAAERAQADAQGDRPRRGDDVPDDDDDDTYDD